MISLQLLPDKPKPKRRWYQYNLWMLMMVMIVFSVWLGLISHTPRKQQKVVAWIKANGGTVTYDFELSQKAPPGPNWLRNWIGNEYFGDVVAVDLSNSKVTDITPLGTLTNLEMVDLRSTQVGNILKLRRLKNLKKLYVDQTLVDIKQIRIFQKAVRKCEVIWCSEGRPVLTFNPYRVHLVILPSVRSHGCPPW